MIAVQVAGLFLAIGAALAFTAWAEAWLAAGTGSIKRRKPKAKRSLELAERRDEGGTIRAA